mmetsp:Transcript_8275/g.17643  ORF Transcript_8275/g.17643 Transcript_8275/m.17643 type:complete len:91 (-) Transcript_8275:157-429(-)
MPVEDLFRMSFGPCHSSPCIGKETNDNNRDESQKEGESCRSGLEFLEERRGRGLVGRKWHAEVFIAAGRGGYTTTGYTVVAEPIGLAYFF